MSTLHSAAIRYLPQSVLRYLETDLPAPPWRADDRGFALMVDCSGFTALADRLATEGTRGIEAIGLRLNATMQELVEVLLAHAGDVAAFAGDALTVVWPQSEAGSDDDLSRILACADLLHDLASSDPDGLALRIAVTRGSWTWSCLGGGEGTYSWVLHGEVAHELGSLLMATVPGETALSPSLGAWTTGARFERASATETRPPVHGRQRIAFAPSELVPLARHLPVVPPAEGARTGETWFAEIRTVTAMFVSLEELQGPHALERAQTLFGTLQDCVSRQGGTLDKLAVDDKGLSALIVWGLPPLGHPDGAVRAIRAAWDMRERFERLESPFSAGIATGRVYCGDMGHPERRDFTVLGDSVNLAARLMRAAPHGEIWVESMTRRESRGRWDFEELPPIALRGKRGLVTAFRPHPVANPAHALFPVIGREAEQRDFLDWLGWIEREALAPMFVLEGEAGIGKSRLVHSLAAIAAARGVRILTGQAGGGSSEAPGGMWQGVFAPLLKVDHEAGGEPDPAHHLEEIFASHPQGRTWIPILGPVLGLTVSDNEWTAQMSGRLRATNIQQLLAWWLTQEARSGPVLVVLEDLHAATPSDWALLGRLRQIRGVAWLLATGPISNPVPLLWAAISQDPDTHHHRLGGLEPGSLGAMVARTLGAESVAPALATALHARTGGNPYFASELGRALLETGAAHLREGVIHPIPSRFAEVWGTMTATIEGAVTHRLDRLAHGDRLLVKVASVLGERFQEEGLAAVFPEPWSRDDLRRSVLHLVNLGLFEKEGDGFRFHHILTRDVAYDLMLPAQRTPIHRAAARWLQDQHPDGVPTWLQATLASHLLQGGDNEAALTWLDLSARTALEEGRLRECIVLTSQALAIAPVPGRPDERARRLTFLGLALQGAGDLEPGRRSLEEALAITGHPVPQTTIGQTLAIGWSLLRSLLPVRQARGPREMEETAARFRLEESLAEIHFFATNRMPMLVALLRGLEVARRMGPSDELSRARANGAYVASRVGLGFLARGWRRGAERALAGEMGPATRTRVHGRLGLDDLGKSDWPGAERHLLAAIQHADSLGDRRRQGEAISLLGVGYLMSGRYPEALEVYDRLRNLAIEAGDDQMRTWATFRAACLWLRVDEPERAALLIAEHPEAMVRGSDASAMFNFWACATEAWSRVEDPRASAEALYRALSVPQYPDAPYALDGYLTIAEQLVQTGGSRTTLSSISRLLKRIARFSPVARAAAGLVQASLMGVSGKAHRQEVLVRSALDEARRLGLPHEARIARTWLLEHGAPDHADRLVWQSEHDAWQHQIARLRARMLEAIQAPR